MVDSFKIIIDGSVWNAYLNDKHPKHRDARQIIERALDERGLTIFITDYMLGEIIDQLVKHQREGKISGPDRYKAIVYINEKILKSRYVRVIMTPSEIFSAAFESIKKYQGLPATLTDWTAFHIAKAKRIAVIASFHLELIDITRLPEFSAFEIWDT